MSSRFHRVVLTLLPVLSLLQLALAAVAAFFVLRQGILPDVLGEVAEPVPRWLLLTGSLQPEPLLVNSLIGISALLIFGLFANLGVRTLYSKTYSPEILFVMLFAASLSLDAWRLGILLVHAWDLGPPLAAVLTRLVLFGRFFGLLCLLASSLYAVGMRFSQYGVLIGGMCLLAFSLASLLPLDTTVFESDLLYRVGDRQGYLFLRVILGLLISADFLIAVRLRRSRRFLLVALAALLLLLGRELAQHGVAPLAAALGLGLLCGGFILFTRQIGVCYLGV
jgi:hypothetical protein